MKFSTQNLLSIREWPTHAEVYRNAVDECRVADGSPSTTSRRTASAARSRRWPAPSRRRRAAFASALPAEIDILSDGRLEFGLGRGYQPTEFRGLGVSMEGTRESFDESLEIVCRAWTEDRVPYTGRHYRVEDVRVLPKPIQKPMWTAAVSPDTYTLAARRGLKILTSPSFTPLDVLRSEHHETLGVAHFMGAFSRGGLAPEKVVRSMRLFAEKVMPKVV